VRSVVDTIYNTPGDGKYSRACFTVYNRNYAIFRIRTCGEANIALSQFVGITQYSTIEINIGAQQNGMTYIRSSVGGTIVAQAETPNILSCSSDRYFWIAWTNMADVSEIAVGRNTQINKATITTWVDFSPKVVTGICVATGNNHVGSWSINTLPGI